MKDYQISLLLDFYGDLLTDRQRNATDLYFNEDLSLSEIAEHTGITRQGVRDAIERAKALLFSMEETLGLSDKFNEIKSLAAQISTAAKSIHEENKRIAASSVIEDKAQSIILLADEICR